VSAIQPALHEHPSSRTRIFEWDKVNIIGCNFSFRRARTCLKTWVKMLHYHQEQRFARPLRKKNPTVINTGKEMSELAATSWVMNFAFIF